MIGIVDTTHSKINVDIHLCVIKAVGKLTRTDLSSSKIHKNQ